MDYKKAKEQILENVGGAENIANIAHCATRLRITLLDNSKFNGDAINGIDGIVNHIKVGSQYQLIVGQNVKYLYAEFEGAVAASTGAVQKAGMSLKDIFLKLGTFIGAAIGPSIIPVIGGGLVKALLTVLAQFALIDKAGGTYILLWAAADVIMQFWPLFIAYGVAKKMNATVPLIMFVALIPLSPVFASYVSAGTGISLFGMNVQLINYYNNFLPALFGAVAACYLERFLKKIIPELFEGLLVPFLVVLIMTPVSLLIIGPASAELGALVGKPLVAMCNILWLILPVLGALMPFLIIFALHGAVFGFSLVTFLTTFGYDPIFMPASLVSHISMGAVAFAVFLKSKVKKTKAVALSSCSSVWLGSVSEPVIFGVVIQSKINALATMAGGFAGGIVMAIGRVKCYAIVGSSWLFIPTFVGEESSLFMAVMACLVACAVAFIITFIFYKEPEVPKVNE